MFFPGRPFFRSLKEPGVSWTKSIEDEPAGTGWAFLRWYVFF